MNSIAPNSQFTPAQRTCTLHIRTQFIRMAQRMFPIFCVAILFVTGCGTPVINTSPPPCVTSGMKDMLIRWGEWNDSTGILDGYELDATSKMWKYQASTKRMNYERQVVGEIPNEQLCYFIDTTRKTFLKIQTLFVKAPRMHYVEYQNPAGDVILRAVWDARYKTFGSQEFRAIFDSLTTLQPPKDS